MKYIWEDWVLFAVYSKITIKSWFQYKLNACIQAFTVFLRESVNIIVMYITLMYFDNINGWDKFDLLFLYSLLYITYGILLIFCTGIRDFEKIVIRGEFDRILLRPRGVLFQIIVNDVDWFAVLGHGGLGISLFIFSANNVGIEWNLVNIFYYVIAIFCGTVIQASLFLFFAALTFYTIKSDGVKGILYWNMRKIAGYPISVFKKEIQIIIIFVVPFAFVNYFPAQYLIRNNDLNEYPLVLLYLSPIIAAIYVTIAYLFWKWSLKKYTSTGN